jgi:hypothetical protein
MFCALARISPLRCAGTNWEEEMNNQNDADVTGIITSILVVFSTVVLLLGVYTVVLATA